MAFLVLLWRKLGNLNGVLNGSVVRMDKRDSTKMTSVVSEFNDADQQKMDKFLPPHSMRRVEIQSIRDVATGSIARRSHQATSSPKLWLSR